jgi:hypothetical protein
MMSGSQGLRNEREHPRAHKQFPLLEARNGKLTGLSSPVSFVAVIYCTCERMKETTEVVTSRWLAAPVFESRTRATHHWAHKLRSPSCSRRFYCNRPDAANARAVFIEPTEVKAFLTGS